MIIPLPDRTVFEETERKTCTNNGNFGSMAETKALQGDEGANIFKVCVSDWVGIFSGYIPNTFGVKSTL